VLVREIFGSINLDMNILVIGIIMILICVIVVNIENVNALSTNLERAKHATELQNAQQDKCTGHCADEELVAKRSGLTKDTNELQAFAEIDTYSEWTGNVMGTDGTSQSVNGFYTSTIPFPCTSNGIYSTLFQKQTDDTNPLHVKIVKKGVILKEASTITPFGIVTLAGQC
jgi:hypothetical protein